MVVNCKSNFHLRSGLQGDHLKDPGINEKNDISVRFKEWNGRP
jgi:hypothetical protein